MTKLTRDRDSTLAAIDATHERWAMIGAALDTDGIEAARRAFKNNDCPLCKLCFSRCSVCPVWMEHRFNDHRASGGFNSQPCGTLRVVRVSIDGVVYHEHSKGKTLRAIGRLLKSLDRLRDRVAVSDNYEIKGIDSEDNDGVRPESIE